MTATGKAIVRINDAALKRRVRGLLAQAWDEGRNSFCVCGRAECDCTGWEPATNPYRDEADDE